jgi:N-acetylmuramoyl-L-alanine amidase
LDVDLSDQSEQVGDILVDLAQRKTLTKSAQFADILLPELSKYSALVGNSHRRAGYYVLLAPDVPAVLLEMGFLSNVQDERLIKSPAHRKNLMKAVTTAINSYFKSQRQLQATR